MKTSYGFGDYFDCLAGVWSIERRISSGEIFKGSAEFLRTDARIYRVIEAGSMRLTDGNYIAAKRQWLWCIEGTGLQVFFDENPPRLYHDLKMTKNEKGWAGASSHSCPPDTYAGSYQFLADRMQISQIVTGPKKDYRIFSEYSR